MPFAVPRGWVVFASWKRALPGRRRQFELQRRFARPHALHVRRTATVVDDPQQAKLGVARDQQFLADRQGHGVRHRADGRRQGRGAPAPRRRRVGRRPAARTGRRPTGGRATGDDRSDSRMGTPWLRADDSAATTDARLNARRQTLRAHGTSAWTFAGGDGIVSARPATPRDRMNESVASLPAAAVDRKAKLPRQIPYIIGNEACERFSFYGMRNILVQFLITQRDPGLRARRPSAKARPRTSSTASSSACTSSRCSAAGCRTASSASTTPCCGSR